MRISRRNRIRVVDCCAVLPVRERANAQTTRGLKNDLILAKVHVGMMEYTSRDIAAPFLLPEMVEARSIHWSPYDRVGVVNAVP